MTTKDWVIPPRPKPGRKPATDTPPTKRKAQNRAAQRAFRERRAARVGELEEQLEDQKEDHDRTVRELKDRVNHLEHETQALQSRCQWLEKALEEERQRGDTMARNWDNAQQPAMVTRTESMVTTDALARADRSRVSVPEQNIQLPRSATADSRMFVESRPCTQSLSISQIISPPEEGSEVMDFTCGGCRSNGPCSCAEEVLQDTGFGCGRCSIDTRCECIEESLRNAIAADHKRPFQSSSPLSKGPDEKRQRSNTEVSNMETDFTALFASTGTRNQGVTNINGMLAQSQPQTQPLASVEPRDSCGFCKDGTYCFCADSSSALPSIPQAIAQQTHTPPPSEDDVVPAPMEVTATGAIKLPRIQSMRQGRAAAAPVSQPVKTGRCGPNGPGTCAQCLADPKSGLFCRSLAANINRQQQTDGSGSNASSSSSGGCCGNGGPGGCCKTGNPSDARSNNNATATATIPAASRPGGGFGVSISCAEAYQTLASHRNFDEAADDIGSWLPKLRAAPIPENMRMGRGGQDHFSGRWAPIEVEAASIMTVLKDFDVRFGRGE